MSTEVSETARVIADLVKLYSQRYIVLANIEKDEHFIAGAFPSVILLDKETKKPQFILEVKRNGSIAQCIQQWKTQTTIPANLFIIVPESDLPNAQSVAQVVGLRNRFGIYWFDEKGEAKIKYV